MTITDTLSLGYAVHFSEPPRIGSKIKYWGGHVATLCSVQPYVRRGGANSFLLNWQLDNGRTGVTGLKSKAMTWDKP